MATNIGNDQPLNRGEILDAIDYEIASIERDQTSPGWTKWTFCGGFATLVWLALSEASKREFSFINTALVCLLCSIFADVAELVFGQLRPKVARPSSINRFRLMSHELAGSRLIILAVVVRLIILLVVYYYLHHSSIAFQSNCFMWFYTFLLFLFPIFLLLSLVGHPVKWRSQRSAWLNIVLILLSMIPLSIALFSTYSQLLQSQITLSDFRLGLIVAAFIWLLPIAASHVAQNQPLLETLKNIRRDLAFNRVDAQSALRQADIALDGMRAEDYLQLDLQNVLQQIDRTSKSMRDLQERLNEAHSLLDNLEKLPKNEVSNDLSNVKLLRAVLEACSLHRSKIAESLKSGQNLSEKYAKKKSRLAGVVDKSEIQKIECSIKSTFEQLKEQAEELKQQTNLCEARLANFRRTTAISLPPALIS